MRWVGAYWQTVFCFGRERPNLGEVPGKTLLFTFALKQSPSLNQFEGEFGSAIQVEVSRRHLLP